jgi:hypothetical protein
MMENLRKNTLKALITLFITILTVLLMILAVCGKVIHAVSGFICAGAAGFVCVLGLFGYILQHSAEAWNVGCSDLGRIIIVSFILFIMFGLPADIAAGKLSNEICIMRDKLYSSVQ